MPAISDPGEDLVRLAAEAGLSVTTVPGPTALVSALALSGLSTSRFSFEGFLSAKQSERKKRLSSLTTEERTMLFYEAPHKLRATLADMCEAFGGERKIAICRELTKLNEEILRLTLCDAVKLYEEREPRGEYVLVLEGAPENAGTSEDFSNLSPEEHVKLYLDAGLSKMDAIKKAAKERGVTKSELYKLLLDT
jgi:16S rRNA (cytidine1402-2'-O)-methyltransferase